VKPAVDEMSRPRHFSITTISYAPVPILTPKFCLLPFTGYSMPKFFNRYQPMVNITSKKRHYRILREFGAA